jgi:hypothetical protein
MAQGTILLRRPVRETPTHVQVRAVDGLCDVGEGFFDSFTSLFAPTTSADGKTQQQSGLTSLINTGINIFGTYQGIKAQKDAASSAEDMQMAQLLQAQQQTQAAQAAAAAQARIAAAQGGGMQVSSSMDPTMKMALIAGGGLAALTLLFVVLRK